MHDINSCNRFSQGTDDHSITGQSCNLNKRAQDSTPGLFFKTKFNEYIHRKII